METINATFANGQILPDQPVSWPEGTRLQIQPVVAPPEDQLSPDEMERLLDEMADYYDSCRTSDTPIVTDEIASRANIYRDDLKAGRPCDLSD